MATWRFTVPGNPVGYYASGRCPNWKRQQAYHSYKKQVQLCAIAAGLQLPLVANRQRQLVIHVTPFFANGVHSDPGNVQKGVTDALFYAGKGQSKGSADKHTGGTFPPPLYDAANPRCEVVVETVEGKGKAA